MTKAWAEQLVLSYNGSCHTHGTGTLWTCAVRPPGIYGPGEQRHLPRILGHARWVGCSRLVCVIAVTYGTYNANVYVACV